MWSWQRVSVNISSVAELSPVYCCLVSKVYYFLETFELPNPINHTQEIWVVVFLMFFPFYCQKPSPFVFHLQFSQICHKCDSSGNNWLKLAATFQSRRNSFRNLKSCPFLNLYFLSIGQDALCCLFPTCYSGCGVNFQFSRFVGNIFNESLPFILVQKCFHI